MKKFLPKQKNNLQGFTLIELLVTISIITVLAAIGMVAYSGVLKQGRDSKRQSDLRAIQSALEQYYSDQLFYPTTASMNRLLVSVDSGQPLTSRTGNPSSPPPVLRTYLNSVPTDPADSPPYAYVARPEGTGASDRCNNVGTTMCTSYCLYAHLENIPSGTFQLGACPDPGDPRYNFAVSPPQ